MLYHDALAMLAALGKHSPNGQTVKAGARKQMDGRYQTYYLSGQ